jgi:hypothetical protein
VLADIAMLHFGKVIARPSERNVGACISPDSDHPTSGDCQANALKKCKQKNGQARKKCKKKAKKLPV